MSVLEDNNMYGDIDLGINLRSCSAWMFASDSLQLPFNTIADFPTTRRSWDGYPISCICKH